MWWTLALALAAIGGCGGGSDSAVTAPVSGPAPAPSPATPPAADALLTAQRISGFPHDIDFYIPAGATRAAVFLHGGLGRNYALAASLGVNLNSSGSDPLPPTSSKVDWDWLRRLGLIAVFPQGQPAPNTGDATTWSNHVMTSGQDDVAFLQALAAQLRSRYGVALVAVAGHSMGGSMVNRLWCESSTTFDAHVAIAGPASAYYLDVTPCAPAVPARYLGVIGSADSIMQNADWTASRWLIAPVLSSTPGFVQPEVIGEWVQHGVRAGLRCGERPLLESATVADETETWSACGGEVVQQRVLGADHGIQQIERVRGRRLLDDVSEFLGPP